jgi:DNA-binding NarL/FixJ family response regulator
VIRVVIVDDQPVVRAGAARILGPADGFEVVAECDDGDEVVAAVAAHRPDLVLMDVRMRRVDGVTAARSLDREGGAPPVLMFTTFDDDDVLWGALDAGAAGFILKDSSAEDLIAAARAVAGGAAWLDPKVAPRVLRAFRTNVRGHLVEGARVSELTDREHDVLRHMARGATNSEIAAALTVSEATVASEIILGAVLGTVSAAVVLVAGAAVYGISMPEDPLAVFAWFLAGLACFIAIGGALGSLLPNGRAAGAIGNLLFVPIFLLGGGGPPRDVMTSAMASIADVLPLSHIIGGLRQSWLGTTDDPHTLWWPVLIAALALLVAVRTARRRAA